MAFSPKSPKARVEPRQALPVMRPRCCFLYLTFFGINMAIILALYLCLVRSPVGRSITAARLFPPVSRLVAAERVAAKWAQRAALNLSREAPAPPVRSVRAWEAQMR